MTSKKKAVVLMQFGGPDSMEAVVPFLYNLFCDPDIIQIPLRFILQKPLAKLISRARAKHAQHGYQEMGGKSPINELTASQMKSLQRTLDEHYGAGQIIVTLAMRYWKPFTDEAVKFLQQQNITDVLLLPLYAQYSVTNAGSSFHEWDRSVKRIGSKFNERRVKEFYKNEQYIAAFNDRIDSVLRKFSSPDNVYILFSAHGTPVDLVKKGDPYSLQIQETVQLVMAARSGKNRYSLAYQSKVGPKKWLEPSTEDETLRLISEGHKDILVVPIAFVSDHIETIHELGDELRHTAEKAGANQFEVTEGLNASPLFIQALKEICIRELDLL
ncbi:MAG TPA: ferrochelatase [Candidatus Kapabacteria bacterium]|nr:ferrochelatase [Candidatus Kapabacteria bacterium]